MFAQTLTPHQQIFLHEHICHFRDILQLWGGGGCSVVCRISQQITLGSRPGGAFGAFGERRHHIREDIIDLHPWIAYRIYVDF